MPVSYTHLDVYKRQEKESLVKIYNIFTTRADLQALLINIRIHQQSDPKLRNIVSRLEANDETFLNITI